MKKRGGGGGERIHEIDKKTKQIDKKQKWSKSNFWKRGEKMNRLILLFFLTPILFRVAWSNGVYSCSLRTLLRDSYLDL